jgi:hypothetical protein
MSGRPNVDFIAAQPETRIAAETKGFPFHGDFPEGISARARIKACWLRQRGGEGTRKR